MALKQKTKWTLIWIVVGVMSLLTLMMSIKLFVPTCDHKYVDGVCTECEFECEHEAFDKDGLCQECGIESSVVESLGDQTTEA